MLINKTLCKSWDRVSPLLVPIVRYLPFCSISLYTYLQGVLGGTRARLARVRWGQGTWARASSSPYVPSHRKAKSPVCRLSCWVSSGLGTVAGRRCWLPSFSFSRRERAPCRASGAGVGGDGTRDAGLRPPCDPARWLWPACCPDGWGWRLPRWLSPASGPELALPE